MGGEAVLVLLAAMAAQDVAAVRVTVDTTATPGLQEYGKKVQALAEEWYPKIASLLPSEGYTPPAEVEIVFRKDDKGVASAGGNRITCSEKWFTEHPEDLGAIVHELTHVVQRYPARRQPGWLVEGIADHVRFFHYEPEGARPRPRGERAKYDASYRTSAAFLEWVRATKDAQIVIKLNAACREGRYDAAIWKERTGQTLEELGQAWKESTVAGKEG